MKTTALILLSLIASNASAISIKKAGVFCISQNLMEQVVKAVYSEPQDENAIMYLVKNGCQTTREQFPITVLDAPTNTISHVRMYNGSESQEAWIFTHQIVEDIYEEG